MQINQLDIKVLSNIPSVSGIEFIHDLFYLIGDNAAHLFVLDQNWNLVKKQILFKPTTSDNHVIPKSQKPDLEALTLLKWKGKDKLLALGSGSKPILREKAFWIDLENISKVKEYSLTELYKPLHKLLGLKVGEKVNIEGVCANEESIFLFQRGNISGKNTMIVYNLNDFVRFLKGKEKKISKPQIHFYDLPVIKDYQSGFSGASFLPGTKKILFTASVEATDNEIDDGKMLGSFIGLIDTEEPFKVLQSTQVFVKKESFLGKIESICIHKIVGNTIQAIAVTDNDGTDSEILTIKITME